MCLTVCDPVDCSTTDSSVLHDRLLCPSLSPLIDRNFVVVKGLVQLNEAMSYVERGHPSLMGHSEEF